MEGESDEIAFSNVSFSYEAKKKVLEGISFRAGHGLTALVGNPVAERVPLRCF